MSQQGNRTEPPSDATAACMCGDEGPNGERCDVCGFNFTSFRKPKPRGVRLNGGGLMLDEEYDPLLGWCYCGKTGPVDEKCKRCYYEFTNDPNLLMREYNSDLYIRVGTLGSTANTDIWSKTGPIHRIGNSSEESLGADVISTIKAPDWHGHRYRGLRSTWQKQYESNPVWNWLSIILLFFAVVFGPFLLAYLFAS